VEAPPKSEAQSEGKDDPGAEQAMKGESAELMNDPFNLSALLAGAAAPKRCGIHPLVLLLPQHTVIYGGALVDATQPKCSADVA
jgi:hypothetical protein